MKKVFIVHGYMGTPNGGWRPWLMGELSLMGVYACALAMPTPDNPSLEEWIAEIARHVERNRENELYLIGHSLGVPAILRFLERTPNARLAGAVLVAGPIEPVAVNPHVDGFLNAPFDFEAIRGRIGRVRVIHGDDDERVPLAQGQKLSAHLDAELVVVPHGGHLNAESGWTTLPQVLEWLTASR